MNNDPSINPEKPYSLNTIERTRAIIAAEKAGAVMDQSPLTVTDENVESGVRYKFQWLELPATEQMSLLRSYGYSKVVFWRGVSKLDNDETAYLGVTTIDTYDLNGHEKDSFSIYQLTDERMGVLTANSESNPHPTGFTDDETQAAFLRFEDLDFERPENMEAHGWRAINSHEHTNLLSIIMACEVEGR